MTIHDFDGVDWAQLARYLGGELSPAETRAFERWLDGDERRRPLVEQARAAWEASAAPPAPSGRWDAEAAVRRLRQAVAEAEARRIRPPRLAWPRRRFVSSALAASLAALGVSGTLVWWLAQSAEPPAEAVSPALSEVTTRRAERAEIRLPDGSRVVLGVASRLRYPRDFGLRARTLELEGEAYFTVVHDERRPFRVRAGAGELEDVGTAFVVRSYDGSGVQVVVTEGAVVVRRAAVPRDTVLLTAAQLARVDDTGIVHRTGINVDPYVAWTWGELAFTDATLADVADELSRWFDVEVRVDDPSIRSRRFTGSFDRQPVEAVVRAIAAATDVRVAPAPDGWRLRGR